MKAMDPDWIRIRIGSGSGLVIILRCWIRIRIRKKWIRIRNPDFFCANKGLNESIGTYLRPKFSSFSQKELTRGRTNELFWFVIFEELKLLQILTMIQILKMSPFDKKGLPPARFRSQVRLSILQNKNQYGIMYRTVLNPQNKLRNAMKKILLGKYSRKFLEKLWQHWFYLGKKNSLVPGGADYDTLRISPRILEKILNGPNGLGWGETDLSRDTVTLTLVNFDFNADPDPAFPSLMCEFGTQLPKLTRIYADQNPQAGWADPET